MRQYMRVYFNDSDKVVAVYTTSESKEDIDDPLKDPQVSYSKVYYTNNPSFNSPEKVYTSLKDVKTIPENFYEAQSLGKKKSTSKRKRG